MATYDYKCEACDVTTQVAYPINENPVITCETCKAEMNKVFSAPQVTFRGGGWGKDAR
jgi:putative FmdB family regulatory protein